MKRIIIDTNCLISFVTDRNLEQQRKIAPLFSEAASLRKTILCHHHVLSEFVYVLDSVYSLPAKNVRDMVTDFVSMPGIELEAEVHIDTVLSFWPEHIKDYGDAVVAAQCKNTPRAVLAIFDKKFRNALAALNLPLYDF